MEFKTFLICWLVLIVIYLIVREMLWAAAQPKYEMEIWECNACGCWHESQHHNGDRCSECGHTTYSYELNGKLQCGDWGADHSKPNNCNWRMYNESSNCSS
jgi:hypothetical protein